MPESRSEALRGRRVLIVEEDEHTIAFDLARTLEDLGVGVVGPAAFVLSTSVPTRDADRRGAGVPAGFG